MDKGEFIKSGFQVQPGINGTWIVTNAPDRGMIGNMMGFSNSGDMLTWLHEEFRALDDFGANSDNKETNPNG